MHISPGFDKINKKESGERVSRYEKLMQSVLSGQRDKNISFSDLCLVLHHLGFSRRVRGDHFIFACDRVEEIINLQPVDGRAKPYQVKQVREIILKYHLGGGIDEV